MQLALSSVLGVLRFPPICSLGVGPLILAFSEREYIPWYFGHSRTFFSRCYFMGPVTSWPPSSLVEEIPSEKTTAVNKKFQENLGPKPLLSTGKDRLSKLKFTLVFIITYYKFNLLYFIQINWNGFEKL